MMEFSRSPERVDNGFHKKIFVFESDLLKENADVKTIQSFGEEWTKFHGFSDEILEKTGADYFDIVSETMLNKNSYVLDIGCGTGRWTKFIHKRAGFIEAVDPSMAIYSADKLLREVPNVRLSKATVDNIPFPDDSFDFGMSIGVLHHIPDTAAAMAKCVKKIKRGGYFYVYLYYNLDNRGFLFRCIFKLSNILRRMVAPLPSVLKKVVCDVLAFGIYMPIVIFGRIMKSAGFLKFASWLPLSYYQNKDVFVIRNDSLDRFGTPLEQRFSKNATISMMEKSGLCEIIVSDEQPFYHAVGRRL